MTARRSSEHGEAAKVELGPWSDCRRPEAAECLRVNLCAQLRGTQASPRGGAEVPNGDVGSRSSVRFWITLVVGGARHTDPASDPKTRIQQS